MMGLEESDTDDVEYNASDEEEEDESENESESGSDSNNGTEEEDGDEGREVGEEEENEEMENEGAREADDIDNVEVCNNEKRKRKARGKKKKSGSEDDEDIMERFEFEVEDAVAQFVDEFKCGRGVIPEDSNEVDDPLAYRDRRIRTGREDRFSLGSSFINGVEFKEAALEYALRTGNNIKQGRWDKNKLEFKCGIGGKCKWRIYCSYDVPKQFWLVKTTTALHRHTCTPNGKCRMLKSPVIARLFLDKLRLRPKYMPAEIQEHIKERWKLVSSRGQCQRGRLKALKMLAEEYATQFAHIRGYAEEILVTNPGSTAIVETIPSATGEDMFDRFYVCFEITRSIWRGSCRPIIGLDGTFLKVASKVVLLAAVGHDANNQIYPLAWAVVQSETKDNWIWFVKQVKSDLVLGDGTSFVLLSDRSKGLIRAVKQELPQAEHRMCVKHIVENLKKVHSSKDLLKPLVWQLAWSYNKTDYDLNLAKLKRYDLALYDDVKKQELETWSLAHFRIGSCCEDVDNNSTKSFNSTIVQARAMALIPMLETIRRQANARIVRRNKKSIKHEGRFSKYVGDVLALEKPKADLCTTYPGTHGVFEVMLDGNSYTVNRIKGTCTCGKWQISGIPCEHAYGAFIDAGYDVEDYVSGFFGIDMWRDNYETSITPLRGPRFWMTGNYGLVVAPPVPKGPGKEKGTKNYQRIKGKHESPKKKKKPMTESLGRKGRIMHCGSCGEAGHNAAGCTKFPKPKKSKKANIGEVGSSSSQPPETMSITQPTQSSQ